MAKIDANGFVIELDDNEIFVFGSNLAGRHGAGAAKQAREQFGAVYGQGEGLQGQSWAFPTLDEHLQKVSLERLVLSRTNLYTFAEFAPGLTFLLTKVGCGLAGFDEEFIKNGFRNHPDNIVLPEDWR